MAKVTKTAKKKIKRTVEMAQAHVLATFNNTIITFTDPKGNKLTSASGGSIGFKGAKKATPFAAQRAVEKAAEDAKELYGVDKIEDTLTTIMSKLESIDNRLSALEAK